uniref:Uncharacterized protein n=1 Tax=Oryza glaberrima TaxID=4538 RepID=I1PKB8_ORYGL
MPCHRAPGRAACRAPCCATLICGGEGRIGHDTEEMGRREDASRPSFDRRGEKLVGLCPIRHNFFRVKNGTMSDCTVSGLKAQKRVILTITLKASSGGGSESAFTTTN